MRRVAFFVGSLVSEFQGKITNELSRASEGRFKLDVFSNLGASSGNYFYRDVEETVVDIANLADYDGIIVAPDSLVQDGLYEYLTNKMEQEAHCPVIAIRCRDERYHNVLIDDKAAMRSIVEHLIDVHGLKRIAFMTGKMELEDARRRLESYREVMAEHNLEITDHMVFEGDYWRLRGEDAVEWFLGGAERPEAIVCSNDYMAISVVNALAKRGIRVPEDIAVTGFDNISEVQIFEPRIASLDVPIDEFGKNAVDILETLMNGEEVPKDTYVPVLPYFEGSCGCPVSSRADIYRKLYEQNVALDNAVTQTTYMNTDYESCITMEELFLNAYRYSYNFNYNRMFFCIIDDQAADDAEEYEEELDRRTVLPDVVRLACIMDRNAGTCEYFDTTFARSQILPAKYRKDEETSIILALKSRNTCHGYIVMNTDAPETLEHYFMVWMQCLAAGIERVRMYERNKEYMRFKVESRLDSLTGLYNRREMESILRRRRTVQQMANFYIMVIDLDGLKYINDTYGHQEGDEAICALADILKELENDNVKPARTGGDEFTVCIVTDNDKGAQEFKNVINKKIDEFNESGVKSFELSASIGYAKFSRSRGITGCINEADKKMYAEKATKKHARR